MAASIMGRIIVACIRRMRGCGTWFEYWRPMGSAGGKNAKGDVCFHLDTSIIFVASQIELVGQVLQRRKDPTSVRNPTWRRALPILVGSIACLALVVAWFAHT